MEHESSRPRSSEQATEIWEGRGGKIDRRIEEGEGEWVVEVAHIQDEIHKVEKDQEHLYTSQ